MKTFKITEEFIQLDKLLKAIKIVQSGGEAHSVVDDGMVQLNGNIETRRRAKIRPGDIVEVMGISIKVINS